MDNIVKQMKELQEKVGMPRNESSKEEKIDDNLMGLPFLLENEKLNKATQELSR